jgi:hypothetical protein
LTLEQLEQRAAAVYSAQTREQAVAAIADLPPLPGIGGAEAGVERPEGDRGRRLGRLVGLGRRGHGDADAPGAAWLPTRERFRDPGSGRIMRVWVDPVSGARRYVSDDG